MAELGAGEVYADPMPMMSPNGSERPSEAAGMPGHDGAPKAATREWGRKPLVDTLRRADAAHANMTLACMMLAGAVLLLAIAVARQGVAK